MNDSLMVRCEAAGKCERLGCDRHEVHGHTPVCDSGMSCAPYCPFPGSVCVPVAAVVPVAVAPAKVPDEVKHFCSDCADVIVPLQCPPCKGCWMKDDKPHYRPRVTPSVTAPIVAPSAENHCTVDGVAYETVPFTACVDCDLKNAGCHIQCAVGGMFRRVGPVPNMPNIPPPPPKREADLWALVDAARESFDRLVSALEKSRKGGGE